MVIYGQYHLVDWKYMEIVLVSGGVIIVILIWAHVLGYDDIIKKAIEAKVEIARETRRTAEANAEEARIKASDAYRSHP